ncbi:MAG: polyhydroxyalkanoate synthesis repressor PhaR [Alphaproteobacteria bacterium]|nr:polyhydroxyalkanoate synthesis repressor PhaR [Alphaproteobacteria bacterium]
MARQKQKSSDADGGGRRVIKKYPNRRLYDTATSSYITLSDVKKMVMDHVDLVVQDAKTQDDLTRSILLQIILEEENAGVPLFSESALANLIRFYGHAMQGQMGNFLESNVQQMMDFQRKMAEQAVPFSSDAWLKMAQTPHPFLQGFNAYTEQMLGAMGMKRPNP